MLLKNLTKLDPPNFVESKVLAHVHVDQLIEQFTCHLDSSINMDLDSYIYAIECQYL